jgi:hypothetical protein
VSVTFWHAATNKTMWMLSRYEGKLIAYNFGYSIEPFSKDKMASIAIENIRVRMGLQANNLVSTPLKAEELLEQLTEFGHLVYSMSTSIIYTPTRHIK